MIFSKIKDLKGLSREELENQAEIAIWLLLNEAYANSGNFTTAPLLDLTFAEEELILGDLAGLDLFPDKSTILRIRDKNV